MTKQERLEQEVIEANRKVSEALGVNILATEAAVLAQYKVPDDDEEAQEALWNAVKAAKTLANATYWAIGSEARRAAGIEDV